MNNEREKIEQILNKNEITEQEEKVIFDIIPELKEEKNFPQNNPWHIYDVWGHTKKVLQNSKIDIETRMVLLLHDIGKPHSFQDDDKIRHFRGHSQKSAEISKAILERLGYEEEKIKEMTFLIENHDKTIQTEIIDLDNLNLYKKLLYIQYCDASGYNPEYIQRVYDRLDEIAIYLNEYEKINSVDIKEER